MSMYGEGQKNEEKNNLFDEIQYFLENDHSVGELLQVVTDVIKLQNGEW